MKKAQIQLIPQNPVHLSASLATFSQNVPQNIDNLEFTLLKKREAPCLITEEPKIHHIAKKLKSKENSVYMLGFYSKKTNKLRLMKVGNTFNFTRKLKNQLNKGASLKFDQNANYMRRKEILVQELGTKKSKKIMRQLKSKVIDEDKIQSADQIKQIIKLQAGEFKEEIKELEAEKFQREWNRKKTFLPDFNLSAKSASKIYNLRSIISEEDDFVLNIDRLETDRVNYYVVNLMSAFDFDEIKNAEEVQKKLLYLNYLVKTKKLRKISKPLEEISESLEVPIVILKSIVAKFFEPVQIKDKSTGAVRGVSYCKSKALDIKLICYIFILNLMVMGFKINLKPLMKVLKIEENVAVMIANEIGCSVKKKGNGIFARLRKLKIGSKKKKTMKKRPGA